MDDDTHDWIALVGAARQEARELYNDYWILLQQHGRLADTLMSSAKTKVQMETAKWWAFDFHPLWYELRPAMELCSSLPLDVPAATLAQLQMRPVRLLQLAERVVGKSGWSGHYAAHLRVGREIATELFLRTDRMEKVLSTLVLRLGLHR